MAELAAFCGKELTKFGFDAILVDDQWQGPAIKTAFGTTTRTA